ncbi:MAG TPA: efflux RND transporter permease subunit [Mariprofundaceae bacterium]|nr:efflux RND transporter permease subunit [Mariprofundaceae bacterium]
MNLSRWAFRHRTSILFLLIILAIGGIASAFRLPVALFPHVNFPRIVVNLNVGDRPAEQMEVAVTRPVEQALRSVPGVRHIRSTTSRGSAEVSVNFDWGSNMPMALQQSESAVNRLLSSLPPGTSFNARRMDPTVFPVAAYSLTSKKLDQVAIRDVAKYQLAPLLSEISGVAKIRVLGGGISELRVDVDPARLTAYGLTLTDVVKALSAANVLQSVGRIEDHFKLYLMLSDTRIRDLDSLRSTVLRSGANGLVRLEDIATVRAATKPQWLRVTAAGRNAVLLQVYQQPGGNTVSIIHKVRQHLHRIRDKLPVGIKIHNWYDQSQLIVESAASVRDAIIIGVILAAALILFFLRSLKLTLISMLIVPAVMAATILLLFVLHMSFNIMTLGGMAAAVGLVIDDAIVMVEHIISRLRQQDGHHREIIQAAMQDFSRPLTGSSMATIIIFLPLAFLSGVTGAFFKALSLTMASSLIISYFFAWMVVPLLAARLLNERDGKKTDGGRITQYFLKRYVHLMSRLQDRPWKVFVGLIPLLLLGYIGWQQTGSGFMPHMDEGGFILDYRAPPGTSLSETDRLLRQVENILQHTNGIATYSRRTGAQLSGGLTEANQGDFFIRLTPFPRRPVEQIMAEVRQRITHDVPGLDIDMAQLMEDLIGDLTAVPQPVEIKLFDTDNKKLMSTAPKVAHAISKIDGIVDVRNGIVVAGDAISIRIQRDKAALEGVNPQNVTRQLKAYYSGLVTTKVRQGIKMVGIRVWVPGSIRHRIRSLDHLWLRAPDGHRYQLKRIASIRRLTGQPQIVRDDMKRMVAVTARISGRDMGSVLRDVKHILRQKGLLPISTYYELGGLYHQQQIAFKGMMVVFGAAIALIFLLLLYLYEDLLLALAIMSAPLLATAAVFIGLWVSNTELNITAMMGMTMIIGIVTEVSIFYFSEYDVLIRSGTPFRDAIIEAGQMRLRPIAMTTFAAILALLPLAMDIGQGSAMQQPMAIAIISGLVVQLPLVLMIVPLLYGMLLHLKLGRSNQEELA